MQSVCTVRLIVLVLSRDSVVDDVLCGYKIPKGTSICISAMTLQRSHEFWEDPDEFRPERFMKGTVSEPDTHL